WHQTSDADAVEVFCPLSLFGTVEILARVLWPHGRLWVAVRYLGLLPVALVAAVVSYRHLSGLLPFYGEDSLTVRIGPLAVDGLMVMATGALIATARAALPAAPDTNADATPDGPADASSAAGPAGTTDSA